jgi:uncharacterized membrane protein
VDLLGLVVLILTGATSSAEFASYAFMHPVVRRQPQAQRIAYEQRLSLRFERVYPVLMPAIAVLLIIYAVRGGGEGSSVLWRWTAVAAWSVATLTTLTVNVPINSATRKWDPKSPPEGWRELRRRWDVFQAVRAWLLLTAFITTVVGFATT